MSSLLTSTAHTCTSFGKKPTEPGVRVHTQSRHHHAINNWQIEFEKLVYFAEKLEDFLKSQTLDIVCTRTESPRFTESYLNVIITQFG